MKNRFSSVIKGLRVDVEGDNIEKALRKFKKKVDNDGRLEDLEKKEEYIKPSVLNRLAKSRAINKARRETMNILGKLDKRTK